MTQVELIQKISSLLTQFSNEVKDKGKLGLYDINVISEDVLVPILSILFETSLKNLNDEHKNFPGIDLSSIDQPMFVGETRKIAFQITSTNSFEKIKKTIRAYVDKGFYNFFDEIYIYNLIEKQKKYKKESVLEIQRIVDNKFQFDLNKNIIDKIDLGKKIKSLNPISKIEIIYKLLSDQFIYKRKSLLSLEIWESEGKLGYGFSNLINSIDVSLFHALIQEGLPSDAAGLLELIIKKIDYDFSINYSQEKNAQSLNQAFNTYLKAGISQAEYSFQTIKNSIPIEIEQRYFYQTLSRSLTNLNENIDENDFPLVNNPNKHPAIVFIRTAVSRILKDLNIEQDIQDAFIRNFNDNIHTTIISTFGPDRYNIHLDQTKEKWLKENEIELLTHIKNLNKLGFSDTDTLQYQEAFGMWQDLRNYGKVDEDDDIVKESSLIPVIQLIEEYFTYYQNKDEGYLNNILFMIADFGKGKTSFLQFYSSVLAQNYLTSHEGLFPVYFNLNEYDKYANSPSLGVIANYMAKRFKIDIKEAYFKKKDYFFLIDSLDECGDLSETNIERVVKDIIEIQNLDNINQRNNRIIITSRPIDKGLKAQISKHSPYPIERHTSSGNENTDNYISVYGFKEEQFDNYIEFAIKKYLNNNHVALDSYTGLPQKIISRIISEEKSKLYSEILDKVLKKSEVRRPIFAYMIYKLIISNSNFIDYGKVGVYISFLNQLSKEAKHKDDITHKVMLKDEFVYRSVLHSSALLWQYKRQSGEQTFLTKADICRTIESKEIDKDDRKVLSDFSDIESIHFLSHSYFGEKENTLHFQHQSFAEILLAEYYTKTILKFAIDENTDVEDARIRLTVGLPTDQTIDFLKGLLTLIKECALGSPLDKEILSKRQLLIPLLASMATSKHNKKLYSTRLNATWFEKYENDINNHNKINMDMVVNFPITEDTLLKVEKLCINIIESTNTYYLDSVIPYTLLFNNEAAALKAKMNNLYDVDKWLILLCGNTIVTNIDTRVFFNSKINSNYLFDMIKIWNSYSPGGIPKWGWNLFIGIDMRNNNKLTVYDNIDASYVDFSYSYLYRLIIRNSELRSTNFSYTIFHNFSIIKSDVTFSKYDGITIKKIERDSLELIQDHFFSEGQFSLTFCFIAQGALFPSILNGVLKGTPTGLSNHGSKFTSIGHLHYDGFKEYFSPLKGLFKYIIQETSQPELVLNSFKFVADRKKERVVFKKMWTDFIDSIVKEIHDETN